MIVGADPSMLRGNPYVPARPDPTVTCGMYMSRASRQLSYACCISADEAAIAGLFVNASLTTSCRLTGCADALSALATTKISTGKQARRYRSRKDKRMFILITLKQSAGNCRVYNRVSWREDGREACGEAKLTSLPVRSGD